MTETPDPRTVLNHAAVLGLTGELLNVTALYLNAPDGSNDEQEHEDALAAHLAAMIALGDDAISNMLLAMASLIIATSPEAQVQAWFDDQAQHIQETLA